VARGPDGTIFHGRNLDFSFSDSMRNITYVGNYYKDGKHIFDAIMFAGDIGIYTGFKEGVFSVSENDREIIHTLESLLLNVAMIFEGYDEISWITRQALIKCETFECAVNHLSSASIIAPGYLTVAGTGRYDGAVISRDRNGAAHIEMLSEERWALVQTNDDHFAGICQTRC